MHQVWREIDYRIAVGSVTGSNPDTTLTFIYIVQSPIWLPVLGTVQQLLDIVRIREERSNLFKIIAIMLDTFKRSSGLISKLKWGYLKDKGF